MSIISEILINFGLQLVYWDEVNLYFDQTFVTMDDDNDVYFNAMVAVQTVDCTPDDVVNFTEVNNLQKPTLSREFQHFVNLNVPTRL